MADFTKLAGYLDSFKKEDPSYDLASFIKAKIAEDLQDQTTINNGSEDDLEDNDITMSTPEQQSQENTEGEMMGGAFQELDVLNKLKEEKEEVKIPGKEKEFNIDHSTSADFGDNTQNQKQASLFSILQNKLKK
jgi:hypothetical protein